MNFIDAVKTVYSNYANFSGRARRSEYWWWLLFQVVISVVLTLAEGGTTGVIGMIWSLANLIPGIAVGVRRLHDLGKSGWYLLIALIPLVGAIVLIVWFCGRGTVGPNEYGNDPVAM